MNTKIYLFNHTYPFLLSVLGLGAFFYCLPKFSFRWINASLQPFLPFAKPLSILSMKIYLTSRCQVFGYIAHPLSLLAHSCHNILASPPTVPDCKTGFSVLYPRLVFSHIIEEKKKKKPLHRFNVPVDCRNLQIFLVVLQSVHSTELSGSY